jgi:hypothetical protein
MAWDHHVYLLLAVIIEPKRLALECESVESLQLMEQIEALQQSPRSNRG